MLRLERDPGALRVRPPARPGQRSVERVARVHLEAGLGRRELEAEAARRVVEPGRRREGEASLAVEHEVVVVASGRGKLAERVADPGSDGRRRREVQRRPGDEGDLAGGDQRPAPTGR